MFSKLIEFIERRQIQWTLTETAWDGLLPQRKYDPNPFVSFVRPMLVTVSATQIGMSTKGGTLGSYQLLAQIFLPRDRAVPWLQQSIADQYMSLWRRHEATIGGQLVRFGEPSVHQIANAFDDRYWQAELRCPVTLLGAPVAVGGAEQMFFEQLGSTFQKHEVVRRTSTGFLGAVAGSTATLGDFVVTDRGGAHFSVIAHGFFDSVGHGFAVGSTLWLSTAGMLTTAAPGVSPNQRWGSVPTADVLSIHREYSST